jgi:MOSC domain-containing protein YiiM
MKIRTGAVLSVQVGPIAPLGPHGVPSGFLKLPAVGPVAIGRLGLLGDAQADLRVHGGPEKAVYLYPSEHYAAWQRELPEHAAVLLPGGFGENLTTLGFDEDAICIGDVLRTGSAVLQVTQPRQPCNKLALRFADRRLPRMMLRSGRSGWYTRVLEEGAVESSSPLIVTERLNPKWPISRLVHLIAHHTWTLEDRLELSDLPGLAEHWRQEATAALRTSNH